MNESDAAVEISLSIDPMRWENPNTGLLDGEARGVFNGRCVVR